MGLLSRAGLAVGLLALWVVGVHSNCANTNCATVPATVAGCTKEVDDGYTELTFNAGAPRWVGAAPGFLPWSAVNCIALDEFRFTGKQYPRIDFNSMRNFDFWMADMGRDAFTSDYVVSDVFAYSVDHRAAATSTENTYTLTMQKALDLALDPAAMDPDNWEYRIGPVYRTTVLNAEGDEVQVFDEYVPYWEICRCPGSPATADADTATCSLSTLGNNQETLYVAMYAIPKDYCYTPSGYDYSIAETDDRTILPEGRPIASGVLQNLRDGDGYPPFYVPDRASRGLHTQFPASFSPSPFCAYSQSVSSVPSTASNAWAGTAWDEVGASTATRRLNIDFSDQNGFKDPTGVDHCDPQNSGIEVVATEAEPSRAGYSYRWGKWGDELSVCDTMQAEADTTLGEGVNYQPTNVEGSWSLLQVPNDACVSGVNFPALRTVNTNKAQEKAWVPYGQRVSAQSVREINRDRFAPLQTSITRCQVDPADDFTVNDDNYFSTSEVSKEHFAFLTPELHDSTVSNLFRLDLPEAGTAEVEVSCPVIRDEAPCGDENVEYRLARLDDVDFDVCGCPPSTCNGMVTCDVTEPGYYGIVQVSTTACETQGLIGDGESGDRVQWAVGYGLGIGLTFCLALCCWWLLAYYFGNCCAWCCGEEGFEKKPQLVPLPVEYMQLENTVAVPPPPMPEQTQTIATVRYEVGPPMLVPAPGNYGPPPSVVTQPVVTQPMVTQPMVTQPVVTQPVVTQPMPMMAQPIVQQAAVPQIVVQGGGGPPGPGWL